MISRGKPSVREIQSDSIARGFEFDELRLRRSRSIIGLAVGVVMMPIGIVMDALLYPDSMHSLATIRFATTLILVIGLAGFVRIVKQRQIRPLSFLLVLAPSLALSLMIQVTDGGKSSYLYGLILLTIVVHILAFRLHESLTYCAVVIASYAAAVIFNDQFLVDGPKALYRGLFFLVTSGLVCVIVGHLNRENRWRAFLLQHELAMQADRRLEFLAEVSHELRTPLTMITAPLDDLLAQPRLLSQTVGQQLAIMQRSTLRLRQLVDDILEVVTQRDETLALQFEVVDMRELVEQVVALTRSAASAEQTQIEITGETSPMWIWADPMRLERVLSNLLGNAMKFSPSGSTITVHLRLLKASSPTDSEDAKLGETEKTAQATERDLTADGKTRLGESMIEVLDQGPGIPEAQIRQIFDRSFQADNVRREVSARGLGLGLAIAKKIVTWHHGQIDAVNRKEGGANFRVRLPLADPVTQPDSPQHPQTSTFTSAARANRRDWLDPLRSTDRFGDDTDERQANENPELDTAAHPGRQTVLIIDDEPDIRQYLLSSLQKEYRTLAVSSAGEGISLASTEMPHCILLDFMLPDVKDFSALTKFRSDRRFDDTKILMLTANADENVKLKALQHGANDFLSKPFGIAELRARVRGLVEAAEKQRDLRAKTERLEKSIEDLKESELKLLQSEKMRSIADLSAGLLHEVNNPVNFSLMAVKVLKRRSDLHPDVSEAVNDIGDGVKRISDIISDLRSFAHPETNRQVTAVDLPGAIRTAKRFAAGELDGIELAIEDEGDLSIAILGSRSQMVQLFLNLIVNAKNAIADSSVSSPGVVKISALRRQDELLVSVMDNGPGMTQEQLERFDEPFFSTNHERGLGLGVPICKSIVSNHGGEMQIESQLGIGTTVHFTLPINPD